MERVPFQDLDPPVTVGIAGGTGSGKTTLAKRIREGVGDRKCTLVQHDWYYREFEELEGEEREAINFDHPESLENEFLRDQLQRLKSGEAVEAPQYDFQEQKRLEETKRVEPKPMIIVEGILLFAVPEIRRECDVKLYVDTDADVRAFRRIRRDIQDRGRDFESVRQQYYETVRPMHLEFVEPSKRWADLIVPEGGRNHIALDLIIERFKQFLGGEEGSIAT